MEEKVIINDGIKTTFGSDGRPLKMEYLETEVIVEYKYDNEGHCIEESDNRGFIKQMNSNGITVYLKGANGHEERFDDNGNRIYRKKPNGSYVEYDKDGHITYYRRSDGFEYRARYQDGKLVWCENSTGFKAYMKYDSNGNMIHYTDSLLENMEEGVS